MEYDKNWAAEQLKNSKDAMSSSLAQNPAMLQMKWDNLMKSDPAHKAKYTQIMADEAKKKDEAAAAELAQKNANDASGTRSVSAQVKYDEQGRPIRNDYLSIRGENGELGKQFSLADKIGPDVQVDQSGYNAIKERALGTGPSAWTNLALEKQQLEQANAMDGANRSTAQAQTSAFNQLRSTGGLSAGQRERLALQGQRQGVNAQQGVMNQGMLNRQNILLEDQKSKDNMLMQLPGMSMNQANFDQGQRSFNAQAQQFDIGNKLKDVGGLNAYNADAYSKSMEEWGANKTAEAQARASSGGKK